ncbi:MAG: hypothetical protein M0R03_13970 [Novosphingobium sp.]|nr:hypothetical protein [Novosphingobium sp.]
MKNGEIAAAVAAMVFGIMPLQAPVAAQAASAIATRSAVFVERLDGGNTRTLEPAASFRRGERIITVLTWERSGASGSEDTGFVITNPLPRAIAFQQSAADDQDVSVDGGRTWGRLGELALGNRLATPEDVTHIRWRISPAVAARGYGRIAYSGIVR